MRDRETIDSELRKLAAMRRSIRDQAGQPWSRRADELLDERLGHRTEASEAEAVEPGQIEVLADNRSRRDETDFFTAYRRKGVLRRFGPLAALPLSLIAVAAVLVTIFAVHKPDPSAQQAQPAQPAEVAPSIAPPKPVAPKVPAPRIDIVDIAFVAALKREGVPVPSQEYVMSQGHAVCDFLAHQPDFAEAVSFVQRSSIWDADQSAEVAVGAVVSYCPQYQFGGLGQTQQSLQDALSGMQAIERDLQGIQGDLHDVRDGLPPIPGQP